MQHHGRKDTRVVQMAKTTTKITTQARWFLSPLHTLSGLSFEAVRAATTNSAKVLPALLTGLLCLLWALTWLERGHYEDIAGRGTAGVGNSQGLQTVLCLHIGHMYIPHIGSTKEKATRPGLATGTSKIPRQNEPEGSLWAAWELLG